MSNSSKSVSFVHSLHTRSKQKRFVNTIFEKNKKTLVNRDRVQSIIFGTTFVIFVQGLQYMLEALQNLSDMFKITDRSAQFPV